MSNLTIQSTVIPYELRRHPRGRYLKISLGPDKTLIISLPKNVSQQNAQQALWQQQDRILDFWQKTKDVKPLIGSRKDYLQYKNLARALVKNKLQQFNLHYQFRPQRLAIKNSRSRWGSCSQKNNLNFHYKILFLPPDLQDYLIVHELCHLQEMNHSKKFWDLVAETIPNYKTCRRELKKFVI